MRKIRLKIWLRGGLRLLLAVGLAGLVWGGMIANNVSQAATVTWPVIHLQPAASGLSSPVSITHADDNSGRLYIVEQTGAIRILQDFALQAAPFLDITALRSCCGERGLLGLAFPPGYASKSHFFIYYTALNGDIVIARYNTSPNRNLADANSGVIVLTIPHSSNTNHNGGQLAFGPDGFLYAGVGDGGGGGDPNNHSQSLNTLLGKLLRIDVEGPGCVQNPPKAQNYCIPGSNPFVSTPGARGEIWAYGLRNPWRFSFDRLTGALYIGDVGQGIEEEVDFQAAGAAGGQNYGWNILEGNLCYPSSASCSPPANYIGPVTTYDHSAVSGCAVTGGYAYGGPAIYMNMQGVYFYADYCAGKIFGLVDSGGWQTQLLTTVPFTISTFGEDESGYLYVADYSHGAVYLIQGVFDPSTLPLRTFIPQTLK
jgi:glucose/arabinose dehydrogenase